MPFKLVSHDSMHSILVIFKAESFEEVTKFEFQKAKSGWISNKLNFVAQN